MSWFESGSSKNPVDVVAVFDSEIPRLLAEIVQAGAMVSAGTTSDGGALGLTVTLDGRWRREYFRTSEEAVPWLQEAALAVQTELAPPPASSAPRQRRRRSP